MSRNTSLQLTTPAGVFTGREKAGMTLIGVGILGLVVAFLGAGPAAPVLLFWGSIGGIVAGAFVYFSVALRHPAGVDNNGLWFRSATSRGMAGWILGIVFTGFYILLYWGSGPP